MKYLKNSKGFTLIELLVTIAIILSILIISIVSITGVSKRKKEEAYNGVVDTIKTAAEQYIDSNAYEFENTSNTKIALKYLIKEGFLNKVIDPITSKAIPECSYVTLERKTNLNKVNLQITDFTISNDPKDCVIVKSNGNGGDWEAPTINYKFMCNNEEVNAEENGWFNRKTLKYTSGNPCTLETKLTITKGDNYKAYLYVNGTYKAEIGEDKVSFVYTDEDSFKSDGIKVATYEVKYKNSENKDRFVSIDASANIDTVAPIVTLKRNSNEIKFTYEANDITSGLSEYKYLDSWNKFESKCLNQDKKSTISNNTCSTINNIFTKKSENKKMIILQVKDEAGNVGKDDKYAYAACDSIVNENKAVYFLGWQGKITTVDGKTTKKSCDLVTVDDGKQYYVAYYRYHSYKCSCNIDTVAKKYCGQGKYVEYSSDHNQYKLSDGTTDYVSRIYYRKTSEGLAACKNQENQYVAYMCSRDEGNVKDSDTKSIPHHGYQWNYGSNSSKSIKNFRTYGWYHSGGCYEYEYNNKNISRINWKDSQENLDNIIKSQCEIACKKAAGQLDYTTKGNYQDCTDSGN